MNTRPQRRAFTLVELMVVVAILGLLVALSMPAMKGFADSNNLTRAGQTIADQIGLARQTATARNRAVEIRLIKTGPADTGYGAVQLWMASASGDPKPLNRLTPLPDGIIVSGDTATLSKALATALSGTINGAVIKGARVNAEYVALQIRPSGLVTPTLPMGDLYLTILRAGAAADGELPRNYLTVQINPNTGTPLIYRP